MIAEIIQKGPSDVEWYVFGGIGEETLFQLRRKNLVKTGFYHQEDLHTLLTYHHIDVICILSKWPETFSYTLSEALCSHIPVIVTDIGAPGQRVALEQCGTLVSVDTSRTVDEVIQCICRWKDKGEDYQNAKKAVDLYRHPTLAQMIEKYQELYTSELEKSVQPRQPKAMPSVSLSDLQKLLSAYELGRGTAENAPQLSARVRELENRLRIIDNSITFKLVLKLTSLPIPFKKQLRAFFMR